jgi:hypothetical protein
MSVQKSRYWMVAFTFAFAVPLVTRSYTDLLALQPAVVSSPPGMQRLFSSQGMRLAKGWVDV